MSEKRLEILHDHYKETFAHVREREKARDRLFLAVIGLFALLAVEIQYPAEFGGSLGSLGVAGGEIELGTLPLPALLNASWVLTLAIALRYCQAAVGVERQYPYLHMLEDELSPLLGGEDVYRREGRAYLRGYPVFLNVAWFAYVVLFPLVAGVATVALIWSEWAGLPYPAPHKALDSVLAAAVVASFALYRTLPQVIERVRGWGNRRSRAEKKCTTP